MRIWGILLTLAQLSKAEEEGSDEVEVRREDQDKINRFSRLHQRELLLQEQLESKNVCPTTDREIPFIPGTVANHARTEGKGGVG